jgi:autotransporter adhesin
MSQLNALSGSTSALTGRVDALETEVDGLRDDAFSGIAAAAALNQITMPSAPGKTVVSLGAAKL